MDIRAISKATAEHYIWGNRCDGWHLVKNPQLSVIQERMPAGTAEVRHFHHRAQQFFYVLAGKVVMEVDGRAIVLSTGGGFGFRRAPRTRCGMIRGTRFTFWLFRSRRHTGIERTHKEDSSPSKICHPKRSRARREVRGPAVDAARSFECME